MTVSVLVSSISQIGLKKSARKNYESTLKEYLNPLVIISYVLFFLSTFLTVYALKVVPLSLQPIIESTGYIFVTVLSYIFLKEKLSKRKIIGMIVIIIGIIVFAS
jgi:small multidrug resistance pump